MAALLVRTPPSVQTAAQGFRLGIYVFKNAEIVDFASSYGVFSIARRYDPELDVFLIADANRPVQAQAPSRCCFNDPAFDFSFPAVSARGQEMHNGRPFPYIESLSAACLLTSVCMAHGPTALARRTVASSKAR